MPIRTPLDFWYPMAPTSRLEDGRQQVSFRPPGEMLSGERLHQWIGARTMVNRKGTDFHRMERQIVFLRALIAQGFDFRLVLKEPDLVRITGEDPLPLLARVTAGWRMQVHDWVDDAVIDGKMVLIPRKPKPRWWRKWRKLRDRLKSARTWPISSRRTVNPPGENPNTSSPASLQPDLERDRDRDQPALSALQE
ncbi:MULTISPECIES: hypothetical protein [unclassified Mesorhizobium]|uniref:hypothetical protein n=1 Tax=unclassified Mesorhizobium TaxID=325217 RepID=UPI001041F799|nr:MULTISPECIES: hypothetical protein [unclassified Mesorhizobium]